MFKLADLRTIMEILQRPDGSLPEVARTLKISPARATSLAAIAQRSFDDGRYCFLEGRLPPEDLGPPKLKKFIVSIRHVTDPGWPIRDRQALERARQCYDAGTHEMYQGRFGNWIVQYLQVRKRRVKEREYFQPTTLGQGM